MARIICPNRSFTGVAASVAFVNGKGETNDEKLIQWFLKNGYEVEATEDTDPPVPPEDTDPPVPPEDTEELKGNKDVEDDEDDHDDKDVEDNESKNGKYAEFSYAELQALAKEKEVSASGKKTDIIARLEGVSDER